MIRVLLAAVALIALMGTSAAATSVETSAGTKSLVFSFTGLSNLGVSGYDPGTTPSGFGGLRVAGVGFRISVDGETALRLGVTFGLENETVDATDSESTDKETRDYSLGINVALEKYLTPAERRVATYLGVGGGVGVTGQTIEPSHSSSPRPGVTLKTSQSGFNLGVAGLAGFRLGVFDGIDLGGEYALGLSLESNKRTVERQGEPKTKNDASVFSLGTSVASLYLSVVWG